MMQKGQKLLIGISILVGVICIELSMYVVPFIEEVKNLSFQCLSLGLFFASYRLFLELEPKKVKEG